MEGVEGEFTLALTYLFIHVTEQTEIVVFPSIPNGAVLSDNDRE
jgi:hypothetical protein